MCTPPADEPPRPDQAVASAAPQPLEPRHVGQWAAARGRSAGPTKGDALADAPTTVHLHAMAQARKQAAQAAGMGEVPVGAVILYAGQIVAQAHNRREIDRDPLAHAELLVLHRAAKLLGRWRLTGCTLVVTLEPCAMCAGAIVASRIDHVIFGAFDARAGAVGSLRNIVADCRLNHRAQITSGVQAELAAAQLQQFFAARRRANRRCGL